MKYWAHSDAKGLSPAAPGSNWQPLSCHLTNGRRVQWSYNSPVLANNTALLFSPAAAIPAVNITVATAPAGLQIVVDSVSYTAPMTFAWAQGSAHSLAVMSPQGAGGTQYTFASWSNGGSQSQSIAVPAAAATYTASFHTQYQLTTSVSPSGAGTITAGGYFNAGSSVQITASASSGYKFTGFSGALTGATNPQSLTIDGPKSVVANFAQLPPSLAATLSAVSGTTAARVWTVTLTNSGLGPARAASITAVGLTQTHGATCKPTVTLATTLPAIVGDLAASGGSGSAQIALNSSGCNPSAWFTVTVSFQANSGGYTGSTTWYDVKIHPPGSDNN